MENLNKLKPVGKLSPFAHFCCTIGNLPTSYMISLTYEEQLLWLCQYLEKTVIPAVNTNAEAVAELQDLYIQLKEYVDNYFKNLDVQEEINNKLDEMAESGQLQEIISEYLELQVTFTYNNVNELKNATNLTNGSFAQTLGFYSYNDNGGAKYKIRQITNTDIVDDMFIIALSDNNLIAELLKEDTINVKQLGITGNINIDETTKLSSIFSKGLNLYFPNGTFNISNTIELNAHQIIGDTNTIFKNIGDNNHEMFNSHNLENLKINNIIFDFGTYTDILKTAINLYSNNNVEIKNCEFKNGYGSQMRLNGSENILIENCYFHDITGDTSNMGNCIYCHPVKNLTIRKCRCNNVKEDFLYLDGDPESTDGIVENVYINNCFINNTGYENTQTSSNSIGINGDCKNIFINDNIITNNINGIKTDKRYETVPSNIYIINNIISNNREDGITLHSNENFIINNKFSYNNQDGFYARESNNVHFVNNIVNNSARYGIYFNKVTHGIIDGCVAYDNSASGIYVGNNSALKCEHITVSNCECYGTTNTSQNIGIYMFYADDVKVLSCKSYNNKSYNYYLGDPNTTNLVSQLNPSYAKNNVRSLMYSNSIPTSGHYNVGDIVFYDTPSAGGYIGAVCTVAGTPGTWIEI